MKALAKYSFMFIALTATAVAAESGAHHEPSIKDLMYPAINFAVLAGFLVWKLTKPMKEMFNKNASDVESLMNSAAQKNKDAEERLKTLTSKMNNLPSEVSKIQNDYESDVKTFAQTHGEETQAHIVRTQRDFDKKLEGEKNELVEKLNEDLLNNVIAKTKQTINGNADMKNRATSKIVSELR
jgi:F-type H+-transporting ATPase subunit b